ncbi:MAG: family 20 glycosylhydrolase [Clostridia bacterium]|nr:family 20 glycosylhydrolase [Clostridia bacterium]
MLPYRGFMLDSVRHMQTIDEIKKLIDALALLKFNKFHWHLTDDQGWRFQSDRYPLLNTDAATRPFSDFGRSRVNEPYGKVFTKAEMREVVAYCAERGIEVVPEFDLPGHTSALLSAYPHLSCSGEDVKIKTHQGIFPDVLCLARNEVFDFVTDILDELLEVFSGEYIHIGGDEAPSEHWENCPLCQSKMKELGITDYADYQNSFMNRVVDYLEIKGRHAIVWNEAARGTSLDKRAIVQYWKEKPADTVRFLNDGGRAILSPFSYCYFDYDYSITPLNRVYSLKPELHGLTPEGKGNVIGIEGTMWTEYVPDNVTLEKLVFPRIIALSRVATGESNKPYKEFIADLKAMKNQLDHFCFEIEKAWTKTRLAMPVGWLKFVKDHYTMDRIKEQFSAMLHSVIS